jgi:2-methylisocitrate lyase-like PEP mutase family enzyme
MGPQGINQKEMTMSRAAELRKLIEGPGIVVLPGAHDALSAKLVEQAGFQGIMVGGFGLSASEIEQRFAVR